MKTAKSHLKRAFRGNPDLANSLVGLLARAAIWCDRRVVTALNKANHENGHRSLGGGVWFPGTARGRRAHRRTRPQRNEMARKALGNALPHQFAPNEFAACHVWQKTAVDEECYTALANLVMLPRALESLTDHPSWPLGHLYLQWKAYRLFGWKPKGCSKPKNRNFRKLEDKFGIRETGLGSAQLARVKRKVGRRRL
jgi:hypothetical protein